MHALVSEAPGYVSLTSRISTHDQPREVRLDMSLDSDMLPAQVSKDSAPPAPSAQSIDPTYQSTNTGAQDVWFFMADADSGVRPSDEVIAETIAADSHRQSTLAFHLFKKPKSTRIRCTLCLSEKNEWRTWLNRIGGISRPMREHLSKEHATSYSQKCTEQGIGVRSGARSHSVSPTGQLQPEAEASIPTSAPNSSAPPPKPPTPQHEALSHIQHVPPPPPPPPPQPPSQHHQHIKPRSQHPYPRPQHHTLREPERRKSALELAQEAVDVVSRPRTAETIEQLQAELDQVRAQRDHEVQARRLLEQELHRMKDAARARDEELLKVSHLISASLQALAGGAVSGPPVGVPSVQGPHPQAIYPYPYPYTYPYKPA